MSESVCYKTHSHVARLTLARPERGNAVNLENLNALKAFIDKAVHDEEVRALVLEGSQGVFCRGLDFEYLLEREEDLLGTDFSAPYLDVVLALRNSPKPVVAAIDGEVLAGGMGLALACDILLATPTSVFGLSEVLFGLIPAYVFPFLLERVPFKKARALVLSSKKFDAVEAHQLGIVDELADDRGLEKLLTQTLKHICYSSPRALALTKTYSDAIAGKSIDEASRQAAAQLTALLNDSANRQAIRTFLEGDKMPWAVRYRRLQSDQK